MGYCFMSIEKIKSFKKMNGKYRHNYRESHPINADEDLKNLNDELISLNGKTYKQAWDEKINELKDAGLIDRKIRKDAVLAFEVVTTFSREDFEKIDIEKWKKDNIEWMNNNFNISGANTNNVVSMMYHGDESGNVHIHSFVIPIDEKGHLNAKAFTSGPGKMRQLQDSYAKDMMEKHGLQRGLKNSVAKHEDVKKFYTKLNQAVYEKPPVPEKDESMEMYFNRVCKFVEEKNVSHLQEIKKLERKIVEIETNGNEELLKLQELENEYKKKLKKIQKMLDETKKYAIENDFNEKEIVNRLKSFNALYNGIKHLDDKEHAQKLSLELNSIIRNERHKERKIKKEFDDLFNL